VQIPPALGAAEDAGRKAMWLSLLVGLGMLAAKCVAWWLTGSAAILSDAIESVIHVLAVGFAAYSFNLGARPANTHFPFGYERIAFFSAGFEGALIILAALSIIYSAVHKWLTGLELERLGSGTLIIAGAGLVNALLGWHLIRTGRRANSIILEANGKHVLTDSWTSLGVIAGLVLVLTTGWRPFDPIFAIGVALNILGSGGKLVWRSVAGLMDYAHPEIDRRLTQAMDKLCRELGIEYHELRCRHTGYRLIVMVHLLFSFETPIGRAHRLATEVERRLSLTLGEPVELVTHLESLEDHGEVHDAGSPSDREQAQDS